MKTFNKTLLAAFVASASAGAFAAGEKITVPGANDGCWDEGTYYCASVGAEGLALGNDVITHNGFDFVIDAGVTGMDDIDRILIEVSGAQFTLDADTIFGDEAVGNLTKDGATVGSFTPQLQTLNSLALSFDAGENFTTTATPGDSMVNVELRNLKLDLDGAGLGDNVQVTVKAQKLLGTNNFTTVSQASGTVAEVVSQLGLNTFSGTSISTRYSGETINATNRLSFTTGSALETTLGLSLQDRGVNYASVEAVSGGEYAMTVTGDFGFLDADGDGELDEGVAVTAGTGDIEFAEDFSSFVVTNSAAAISGSGSNVNQDVKIELDGEREIPELSATGTMAFNYQTVLPSNTAIGGGTFEESALVASWALQGVTTTFSYMPYGPSISQILFVTNNGYNDGRITVSGWDEAGNKYGPVTLDKVATARGVTKVTGEVEQAMLAEGFSGRGALKLSITVNTSSAEVYGAYNVGGADRGYVPAQQ
ncbi:hypothetical protein DEU29_102141 [Idiomarina aquatica]|uniref:Uncharacterized protein n=1 Tax=Idiomarina aquatica TaxID=1327752 RepID=A0A4R6PQY6_9GAMM|nr:hypothetical protein [Idiomarina aquatica]TDP40241.1 hypothetical protein DEU29_102141 [Idiomarina aquatica]